MGSRQSVAQPARRTQSHASTSILDDDDAHQHNSSDGGPSTSNGQGPSPNSRSVQNRMRSHSLIVPIFGKPSRGDNDDTSGDSSGEDDTTIPAASVSPPNATMTRLAASRMRGHRAHSSASSTANSGIPALDRLLRLNTTLQNAGLLVNQMPLRFFDIKCPVCHKVVPSDDVEYHLVVCLTRPRLTYNDDVLSEDKGECAICFEEMSQGDTIARLPCLCVYHKGCIDSWFKVKNSCPEHPSDD